MQKSSFKSVKNFVRAGAGAGKTYTLTREVVRLAEDFRHEQGGWPKTVLTTFTRKATQELKERMLRYSIEERPGALEYVQSTSYLNITTMHGLFSLFLSRHGHVLGLPSQFEVVDEVTTSSWRKKIVRDLIGENPGQSSMNIFPFYTLLEHLRAYERIHWLGKASAIRSEDQFEKLYLEWRGLMAADLDQMINEGSDQVEGEAWDLFFSTLSSLKEALLNSSFSWEGLRPIVAASLAALVKPRRGKNNPGLEKGLDDRFVKWRKNLQSFVDSAEYDSRHWPLMIQVFSEFQNFAGKYCEKLFEKKIQEGALEADDLEIFSYRILKEHPETLKKFADDFDAWFIDEFQDTSPLQLEILEAMLADNSQFLVGDPQQSIYLFRGSRSEVFFQKQKRMGEQGADLTVLKDNYRSQSLLLGFFNDFFTSLDESFSSMEPQVEALPSRAAVHISLHEETEKELARISGQLKEILDRGASPKDICLLTRTHSQVDRLQKHLTGLGFPVISHSSSQFYGRREVLDALSLLHFLINPWDDENLLLLLRSPWLGFDDGQLIEIIADRKSHYWKNFSLHFQKAEKSSPAAKVYEALYSIKDQGVAWVFRRLLIELKFFDYSQRVDPTGRREANLWKLINAVEKLAREPGNSLMQFVKQGLKVTDLESVGEASDASAPSEPNKINLMTVHASKGLQFDHVFLPFLNSKGRVTTFENLTEDEERNLWSLRLPLKDKGQSAKNILEELFIQGMKKRESEESLRVLYVAMTRAKKHLYLSWRGEPDKTSWGELLQDRMAFLEKNGDVDVVRDGGWQDVSFQQSAAEIKIRKVWADLSSSEESAAESDQEANYYEDWQALADSQSFRRRGVVLHKVFESLKEHSIETTRDLAARWLPDQQVEVVAALDFIVENQDVPFYEIIQKGFSEWGYQKLVDGRPFERRIDLWAQVGDKIYVVDYKTGSTKFKSKAFEQMASYAEALTEYLGWSGDIELVAAFPFSQEVFQESWKPENH